MAVFGLLHGAFEGAWCWDLLIPELNKLGHWAIAVDLPIDDVTASWDDHVDSALGTFGDPGTVVVAHSRSGRMVPRLLERGGYRNLILLAAAIPGGLLPPPYVSTPRPRSGGPTAGGPPADELGRSVLTRAGAEQVFAGCSPEIVDRAVGLLRPQHELPSPSDTIWPPVNVSYVFGEDDAVVDPAWMRAAAAERLGVTAIELPGGHSLFLSHQRELAQCFDAIVATIPEETA
ncbi:alpha/beta fold hydrolase [Gordonia amarae]|uniref:Alpha/beta fold hydrolase n=2 Tax=Gordonia amarae TaxID=36821 RepID=A0A857LUA3_9ACTN|nr:alpha/beta hydrolase [Gordonia amarae]MCS3876545.1 hypothetical protein [Gordonia amarae]QHN19445.1 alpha/beta fold hydrolase [Gordonia amarae]QHN23921.1 alpha/beta fold hydrolase [Gordonia amarae]QHN32831.1 alpha/beta fold hydrolase [Gordonia amarae]QHN41550.1 alpha/beta fold hydrolase [Gordonia amarae]